MMLNALLNSLRKKKKEFEERKGKLEQDIFKKI